jgi:diguanylate cyclase (GGDEF)-like protein
LAQTDSLTKLPNRRCFDQTIEREWSRAQRNVEWLALLMIDADRFKSFNDRYGHQEGDALLSWIALCIADAARRGTDFAARYGGEEFVVLLTSADREMAKLIAETIRHSVEMLQVDHADAPNGFASVSIGVACARPDKDANLRALIAAADRALFDAKRNGRNKVEFADPDADIEVSVESAPRLVA